ncbi:unnamed protein product, partial [Brachionus calyciflorus]
VTQDRISGIFLNIPAAKQRVKPCISSNALNSLINLKHLDLSHNNLRSFNFESIEKLENLSLFENELDYFSQNLPNLKILELSLNPLKILNYSVINNKDSMLETFSIRGCDLKELRSEAFQNLKYLQYLSIYENDLITYDSNLFFGLSYLETVSLNKELSFLHDLKTKYPMVSFIHEPDWIEIDQN